GGAVSGSTSPLTSVAGGSGVRSKSRLRRYSESSVIFGPGGDGSSHHPIPVRSGCAVDEGAARWSPPTVQPRVASASGRGVREDVERLAGLQQRLQVGEDLGPAATGALDSPGYHLRQAGSFVELVRHSQRGGVPHPRADLVGQASRPFLRLPLGVPRQGQPVGGVG